MSRLILLAIYLVLFLLFCQSKLSEQFTLTPDNISPAFRRYDQSISGGCLARASSWILQSKNESAHSGSFHRFFDSSPFSPSGRYIGFTRTFAEGIPVQSGMRASVIITDLLTGTEETVAQTYAWDSQLGAQVQWGQTDDTVYFNDLVEVLPKELPQTESERAYRITGVMLDRVMRTVVYLPCSLYHVSYDGSIAVSPAKLSDMHLTQKVAEK